MGTVLLVGTRKGAVVLRSTGDRQSWQVGPLTLRGWKVTAFTRDGGGRYYAAVTHDVYGSAILAHDELGSEGHDGAEGWKQLDAAPRYEKGEVGNVYTIPSDTPLDDLYSQSMSFDTYATSLDDVNAFFPITHLRTMVKEGRIGSLAPNVTALYNAYSQRRTREVDAPEVLDCCRAEAVDVALMVPV